MEALQAASLHTDFDQVILDAEKQTVFFADPRITLDIGAVAKGWAADAAAVILKEEMPSFLLSLGGNVYTGEAPLDGRASWAVGVQDPRPDDSGAGGVILDVVEVNGLTVVTSGDYWRYYEVDGQRYHHIIDPETLFPSTKMLSVTIICESSTLADFLSTTLFVLSAEDGLALIEGMDGVEAFWVLPDGSQQVSSGMGRYLRSIKNAGSAL
jgi:thiamine biosynthesis lipoprotein